MIRFNCPHCSAVLVAQPQYIGREALCKNCQKYVCVPEPPMAQAGATRAAKPPLSKLLAWLDAIIWAVCLFWLVIQTFLGSIAIWSLDGHPSAADAESSGKRLAFAIFSSILAIALARVSSLCVEALERAVRS